MNIQMTRVVLTWRDLFAEDDVCTKDLFVTLERNVSTDHVIQENTKRPDCRWDSVVPPAPHPLRRTVDACT